MVTSAVKPGLRYVIVPPLLAVSASAPCSRVSDLRLSWSCGVKREAFNLFYEAAKAGLEHYEVKADRMSRRLAPGRN